MKLETNYYEWVLIFNDSCSENPKALNFHIKNPLPSGVNTKEKQTQVNQKV